VEKFGCWVPTQLELNNAAKKSTRKILTSEFVIYKIFFEIPKIPPSLNKTFRTHYHVRNKIFKEWYQLIQDQVKGKEPPSPLPRCRIEVERCFYRMLDYDGLVASLKPAIDGLIHSSIILDDTYKITGPWIVTQSFRKKKEGPLLKVKIYELPIDKKSNG
tara:strand:+ start:1609 stop:2088 length:480 start_codon:yes stop_codon:yes gene_type:complete